MTERKRVRGHVISLHALGAAVRLEDGTLVAIPIGDVESNRETYERALHGRREAAFEVFTQERGGTRRTHAILAMRRPDEPIVPQAAPIRLVDEAFEAKMDDYLRSTQEWAPPDLMPPAERHFLRKRQRAAAVAPPARGRNRGTGSQHGESGSE